VLGARSTVEWPTTGLVVDVVVTGLPTDLTLLSYDDLFDRYKAAVAAVGQARAKDAARIEEDIIVPLNEELARRSRLRRRGS
jgi:hypothetical protein